MVKYFISTLTANQQLAWTKKERELPRGTSPPCKLKTTNKRMR